MLPPANQGLPFFAYGIFRPGQLAYFQLADAVTDIVDPVAISGRFLVRDGLPLIELVGAANGERIEGALLTFQRGAEAGAYERIAAMEPDAQYLWNTVVIGDGTADRTKANILVAKTPNKGIERWDFDIHEAWDGWLDPVFTDALKVVDETLAASENFDPSDMRPTFRLQMAYLLLWSSIERYLALRYNLGPKHESHPDRLSTYGLVKKLIDETAFAGALTQHVSRKDRLYRADDPDNHENLDPTDPTKCLGYYYQVRSNITHRGKGVTRDHNRLYLALSELLPIFRDVVAAAKIDAERLEVRGSDTAQMVDQPG